ncbi:MAG: metalloregulator ArsR/SmtB family transcription factor, partial [Syntrophothermus sp.]
MEITQSLEIIKSLSDTSRLRVINCLLEKPQYVEELAQRLNLAFSTVSFHLKKLESANLVYKTKEQYYIVYHICDDIFNTSLKELISFNNMDKYVQDERINKYKTKVLKTFFVRGKLKQLPVQHKKKMIVLEEFYKKFKPDVQYAEKDVNEMIIEKFDDYCLIRRLMIEEGMMKRQNQTYWVNPDYKGE